MRTKLFVQTAIMLLGLSACAQTPQPPTLTHKTATPKPLPTKVVRGYDPEPKMILRLNDSGYDEAFLFPFNANGDGFEDILVYKTTFQTEKIFEIDILINDTKGGFDLVTDEIFSNDIPVVQNASHVLAADFNGDGRDDIFISDHGYDVSPHPGFQNALILSNADGIFTNATNTLPQQYDFSHAACAGDIDNDGDMDLYVGNIWGLNNIDPILFQNNGTGSFVAISYTLPPLTSLDQNGFTICEFVDVNNDGAVDLILGDAGDDLSQTYSTRTSEILLNNGVGYFTVLPGAIPEKNAAPDIAHDIETLYLDGDEYIDLIIVYESQTSYTSYIQILINNQDGTFQDESSTRLDSLARSVSIPDLELRDMDGDRDLDLIAAPWDWQNPDPLIMENNGMGSFTRMNYEVDVPFLYYTFIDIDNDGDQDVVYWGDAI